MALFITGSSGRVAYPDVLNILRRTGVRRPSRNGPTLTLDDVTIALDSPLDALPIGCGRNPSLKIAAAEALQLIGGFSDVEWMLKIAPQFDRYAERWPTYLGGDRYFHGAYGIRVSRAKQLETAIDRLRDDPFTRQAVVTLWDPELDTDPGHLDYPCTVAIGFSRRGASAQMLDCRVTMRSNDAWLGLPYDLFQFTQLQLTICNILNLDPGTYTHTAWSLHLYEPDIDKTYDVDIDNATILRNDPFPARGLYGTTYADVCGVARWIRDGGDALTNYHPSERWYAGVLASDPTDVG